MSDDFAQASEILAGRFYFTCIKRPDSLKTSHVAATSICYSIDDELVSPGDLRLGAGAVGGARWVRSSPPHRCVRSFSSRSSQTSVP